MNLFCLYIGLPSVTVRMFVAHRLKINLTSLTKILEIELGGKFKVGKLENILITERYIKCNLGELHISVEIVSKAKYILTPISS